MVKRGLTASRRKEEVERSRIARGTVSRDRSVAHGCYGACVGHAWASIPSADGSLDIACGPLRRIEP